jgi:hypothetical protein
VQYSTGLTDEQAHPALPEVLEPALGQCEAKSEGDEQQPDVQQHRPLCELLFNLFLIDFNIGGMFRVHPPKVSVALPRTRKRVTTSHISESIIRTGTCATVAKSRKARGTTYARKAAMAADRIIEMPSSKRAKAPLPESSASPAKKRKLSEKEEKEGKQRERIKAVFHFEAVQARYDCCRR